MLDFTPSNEIHHYTFDKDDRVEIDGVGHLWIEEQDGSHLFQFLDGTDRCTSFTAEQLSDLGSRSKIRVQRGYFGERKVASRLNEKRQLISSLPPKARARVAIRHSCIKAMIHLHGEGRLKFTDQSITAERANIFHLAGKMLEAEHAHGSNELSKKPPSSRTLRTWMRDFRESELEGLIGAVHRRGNTSSRLAFEVRVILMRHVQAYLTPEQPTQKDIHTRICDEIVERNKERREKGMTPLAEPSQEAVRQAIRRISPLVRTAARKGVKAAEMAFRPVGQGLDLHDLRPMQRVEIDEHKIDLITLFETVGLDKRLFTVDEWEEFKLDIKKKRKGRLWLTVAICARTRCIVGMTFSANPDHRAAMQVLQMCMSDKGVFADLVGSLSPWSMHAWPEEIVSDLGSAFIANEFTTACSDLGISVARCIANLPQQRGTLERFFQTLSVSLMSRLNGRTFSDVVKRGALDPADRAAINVQDLLFAVVRWIVDCYHNTPHAGLDGETPLRCWRRLTKTHGVTPPPDMRTLRMVFGQRYTRKLSTEGLCVHGVRYHNDLLAQWMARKNEREISLRWHPKDVGAIEVYLDGEWYEVKAVDPEYHGVPSMVVERLREELKAQHKKDADLDRAIVLKALRAIIDRSQDAIATAGLMFDVWDEERKERVEAEIMAGIRLKAKARPDASKRDGVSLVNPTGKAGGTGWTVGEDD